MSRSGYVDDLDDGVLNLYRASVDRAISGKRGQAFLRELADAMDAMTEKVLIAEELVDAEGDCCAIGCVMLARGIDPTSVDDSDPMSVGDAVGIARSMAAEIEYINDEDGPWRQKETPQERWIRVRTWVARNIIVEIGEPDSE